MRRLGVSAAIVAGQVVPGDVAVDGQGRVDRVGLPAASNSKMAVPGLVDLQVNGYAGVDFLTSDADGWLVAAQALAADGVAWFLPTLITSEPAATRAALARSSHLAQCPAAAAARSLGIHLEGPFLAPGKPGTHPRDLLREPDLPLLRDLMAAGPVKAVTLAPELAGALALVDSLVAKGVLVSVGHSAATAQQAHAAFDAGARAVTHVFNAMSAPTAREAGVVGAALVRSEVSVQLICDGVHVSLDVVRLVRQAAGDRVILVTDAIAAAGVGDGDVRLGDVEVRVRSGEARRADGTLAGGVTTLLEAVRQYVLAGAALEEAVAAVTTRPAALLGADIGQLRPGDPADLIVLDDALQPCDVVLAGETVPRP